MSRDFDHVVVVVAEDDVDSTEFSRIRQRLKRTQKQRAPLLGISLKAVESYEQGWRDIPAHVERQMLLLDSLGRPAAQSPATVL